MRKAQRANAWFRFDVDRGIHHQLDVLGRIAVDGVCAACQGIRALERERVTHCPGLHVTGVDARVEWGLRVRRFPGVTRVEHRLHFKQSWA